MAASLHAILEGVATNSNSYNGMGMRAWTYREPSDHAGSRAPGPTVGGGVDPQQALGNPLLRMLQVV